MADTAIAGWPPNQTQTIVEALGHCQKITTLKVAVIVMSLIVLVPLNYAITKWPQKVLRMARKRYLDEDALKILLEIDVLLHDGLDVLTSYRKAGISDKTYHCWRKKFGGWGTHSFPRCVFFVKRTSV